jgi:hypothetical protein
MPICHSHDSRFRVCHSISSRTIVYLDCEEPANPPIEYRRHRIHTNICSHNGGPISTSPDGPPDSGQT